jgi:hypothetical protein
VHTTLDLALQEKAEQLVLEDGLSMLGGEDKGEAALVVGLYELNPVDPSASVVAREAAASSAAAAAALTPPSRP